MEILLKNKTNNPIRSKLMNKQFNTTTLRLTPTKALLQLQHQTNHYKNIVSPRKITSHLTSRDHHRKKTHSGFLDCKFEKQKMQSIQRQNFRIFKDCRQIYKNKGILQKAEQQFQYLDQNPKATLISTYKTKQKMNKIQKENANLKKKLQNLKPLIGDQQKWKKHQDFTTEQIHKLQNKGKSQSYNTDTIVRIALSSQKQRFNYLKLFRTIDLSKRESLNAEQITERQKTCRKQKKSKKKRQIKKQIVNQKINMNQNEAALTKTTFSSEKKPQMEIIQ